MRTVHRFFLLLLILPLTLGACTKKETSKLLQAAAGPVGPPEPVAMPQSVLAWAVAGNPQKLLQTAETLAGKAAPVPAGTLSMGISAALLELGLKDTSVIDLTGPAGLLMLDPTKYEIPTVVAITTKGEKAVLESAKPTWKHKGAKDGIHELTRGVLDTYAVFKGGQDAARQTVDQSLFVRFEGTITLIAPERGALADGGSLLLERLKAGATASGVTGALHVDNLRKVFGEQLAAMPQMLKQKLKSEILAQQQPGMPNAATMEWLLGWAIDKVIAFIEQTGQVGLAVGLESEGAVFHVVFQPEKDSFFAKILAAQKPAALRLVGGLPAGSPLAIGMNVQWEPIKQDLIEFATEIFSRVTSKEPSDELKALMKEWFEVTGDEVAVAMEFDDSGAMRLVEMFEVTDEARARKAMNEMMKLTGEMYKDGGIYGLRATVEEPKKLDPYDGVELEEMSIKMDLSSLPPMQAKIIRKTYGGDEMRWVSAVFDKTFALAIGPNAEADIKATIGRMRKKTGALTSSAMFSNAAGGLDKGAGAFMFMSISQFVATSIKSTLAMTGAKAPEMKLPEPRSGMFLRIKSENGRLIHTLRLPAAHLEEMGAVFKAISQASMGQPAR